MNKILQNSINTGKVRSFVKNMIVRAEEEERHNKVVMEVVKQLAENNLYIKPEKYKQKVREVGFLEVVIRLEGIKMEEKKVKGVLDQLTLKGVKRCTEVFRTSQLQLAVHSRFHSNNQTIT